MAIDTNAARQGLGTSTASGGTSQSGSSAPKSPTTKRAEDLKNAAGDMIGEGVDRAGDAARGAADYASAAASRAAREAQSKVNGLLSGQIAAGADYVAMIAETAESAAGELEDKAPELARLVRDVADRTSQFADDLRDRSPEEMMEMATDWARANPRLFFGGAIAAGFLLSRFLKSGSSRRSRSTNVARTRQGGAYAG